MGTSQRNCGLCAYAGPRQGYEDHECRRRAPVAERVDSSQDIRLWVPRFPLVKASDWCGEWAAASEAPKRYTQEELDAAVMAERDRCAWLASNAMQGLIDAIKNGEQPDRTE